MKLLPQHTSSLLYVNIGGFISPISREDGSALMLSTQAFSSCRSYRHFKGNSEELPGRTNLISFSRSLEFISCLGGWRAAPKSSGMAAHVCLSSACSERLRKALQVALWDCVHQSQGSDKVLLFLSFKQRTYLIYLHWLQIWLASMLTVYQNLIKADETNRNKEVGKYLKMNHLS